MGLTTNKKKMSQSPEKFICMYASIKSTQNKQEGLEVCVYRQMYELNGITESFRLRNITGISV